MSLSVILLVVHVCLALAIISLILLQKGAGASAGAAFGGGGGGGGAGSIFGASGSSNFLSKTTAILATCFFVNSLALAYLATNRDTPASIVDMLETETAIESVETPATGVFGGDIPLPTESSVDSDVPPAAE